MGACKGRDVEHQVEVLALVVGAVIALVLRGRRHALGQLARRDQQLT